MERGGQGLLEAAGVWAMYLFFALVTVVTYARLPKGATYHFPDTGISGGLGRALVDLNFPVALAAIPLCALAVCALRTRAAAVAGALAIALCAVVAAPGLVSSADLRATWANAVPAAGVGLAAALSAVAIRRHGVAPARRWRPDDSLRLLLVLALAVWSIPWIVAAFGFYVSDIPLLGRVFLAREPTPGEPAVHAVHRGLHEGLYGAQLAITALALSRALSLVRRPAARTALSLYLALVLVYGLFVTAQDGWHEQVVKRGLTDVMLPDVLEPALSAGWLAVLAGAAAVHVLWFRREWRTRAGRRPHVAAAPTP